jgi:hypothetical protein
MNTLQWRHTDWTAKSFVFSIGEKIIGQLTFAGSLTFSATYNSNKNKLKFSEKDFWGKEVSIEKDGNVVALFSHNIFGNQTLTLKNGDKFSLTSDFWGSNAKWQNLKGDTIVTYSAATMSTMGKGTIHISENMDEEIEEILFSGGLFIKQYIIRKFILISAILSPLTIMISRMN